eukprot:11168201-Lingulodinium_polyedra.AAC.1
MGRRKKPGIDGRYAGEFEILEILCAVLAAVEDAGARPDCTQRACYSRSREATTPTPRNAGPS